VVANTLPGICRASAEQVAYPFHRYPALNKGVWQPLLSIKQFFT
jgi:hypothetical protein